MHKNYFKVEGDINTTPRRQEWQDNHLDQATKEVLRQDANVFIHQSLSTPCLNVLEKAQGVYIKDLAGKSYMDFHGNSVHQVGYNHPNVIEAMKKQLDDLSFSPRRYTNKRAVELASRLIEKAPGDLNKILFAPSGTSAIGIAMKLARRATGKHRTISLWDAFHGASLDAISIGGEQLFRKDMGPLLAGCEHILPYNSYRCIMGKCDTCGLKCLAYLEYILERQPDVGAIFMETIRSTDVQVPTQDYYKRLRQICDKFGVLLVLDEIPTAMGRTGTFYAFENFGIVPDMVVIGKGLGAGVFPMAALIAREGLDIASDIALGHYTHEKSPLGSAAALAAIDVIEGEGLLDHAKTIGQWAIKEIQSWTEDITLLGDVRGKGLLIAIELVLNKETKEKAIDAAESVLYECLKHGLSFKVSQGNVLTLVPPLVVTRDEMDQALKIIKGALIKVQTESLLMTCKS